MEAIIRTENKTLFDALLHFLRTLNITVEPKEKEVSTLKKTKKSGLDINDFSFFKSMEATKGIKGSLSDAVIEERRGDYR
ncbi:MAG: hypothetical protein HY738_19230 [Bacteroidia bacterium]|nr:hypothetical protein [Bacteroidia bacterium]